MQFEYDPEKSDANKRKHGIDFEAAKDLWEDMGRVEAPVPMKDEPRELVVGKILGKYWTAVVTERGPKTRIISVRRSREKEVRRYEENISKGV